MSEANYDILIEDHLPRITKYTDPDELWERFSQCGVFDFEPRASGLMPASVLPEEIGNLTTMNKSWDRDNSYVGYALLEAGRDDLAIEIGRAQLQTLHNNQKLISKVINDYGTDPTVPRMPVRFDGDTLENDKEPRVQNDGIGLKLWFISELILQGKIQPTNKDLDIIEDMVTYLAVIEYWKDYDQSCWEEDDRLHVSSIGPVERGLLAVKEMFAHVGDDLGGNIDWLIEQGTQAREAILASGHTDVSKEEPEPFELPEGKNINPNDLTLEALRSFSIQNREVDAAMLFLIEPLHVLSGAQAKKVITDVERYLKRDKGVARYLGDSYWGPDFHHVLEPGERTAYAEGATQKRNERSLGIYMSETEAQWTLFDPVLGTCWGEDYIRTDDEQSFDNLVEYLNRVQDGLVPDEQGRMRPVEAFYFASNPETGNMELVPNDHKALLWTQANIVRLLQTFKRAAEHRRQRAA